MGLLDKRRERKELEAAQLRRDELSARLETAETVLAYARLETYETSIQGVALKRGERAFLVVQTAGLVEPRRLPGQWTGGSKGVSFRIAKGVTYRMGTSRGTYAQGEEVLQPIDVGTFVVTNQRCLFVGPKRSTEWAFAKLLGFSLDLPGGVAVFNVSNRQKASGVTYGTSNEAEIEAVIAAAIARFQSDEAHEALLDELRADVDTIRVELTPEQPRAIQAPDQRAEIEPAANVPPGWYPDPSRRFEQRYFDGHRWTHNVLTGGVRAVDPVA
jgi:hypothetical protein